MKNVIVILDPAHGKDVLGKCSPDKSHFEWIWSRERCKELEGILTDMGYEVHLTNCSDNEIGLTKRKNFASSIRPGKRKLLLSLHNNAAGNGDKWKDATGVEFWTTVGVTDADICADILFQQFKTDFPELRFRLNEDVYLRRDKEKNFTVLTGNGYMGVLIEWLFQDNIGDVERLKTRTYNDRFNLSLVCGIEKINAYFSKHEETK